MRYFIRRVGRPAAALRALAASLLTLTVATACERDDPLPTGPPIAGAPNAAIVGADVTVLPFAPVAINDVGQVVGSRFLWTPAGGLQDIGTLGGTTSFASAINDAGQVVGWSYTQGNAEQHAFLWTPGQGMQDLGTLGGTRSQARGINDNGQVVGESFSPSGTRAFLWTPEQGMQDLGALGGDFILSRAYAINNAGRVVGESFTPGGPGAATRAFLWAPGQGMQDLGTLGGALSIARDINEAGEVVGQSWTSLGPHHAFLWTPGEGMRDLGTLIGGAGNSAAYGINDVGQVVGESSALPASGSLAIHAFLWSTAEGMEDLWPTMQTLVAQDINNRQQVVGGSRVATLRLEPGSRPPVADVGGPYTGTEGSAVTLNFSATDPDGDVYLYVWDRGDGTGSFDFARVPGNNNDTHVYADDGTYTVTLIVRDAKANVDTSRTTATIANVAPTIPVGGLTGPAAPIQLTAGGARVPIVLAFTDPAGANDTYAAGIECGNGTTLSPGGITSPYATTCTYASAGEYTMRATVSDEDGGTSEPAVLRDVVVYDPDGGFTTGSGHYAIPGRGKGGKAHFTFNARFLSGETLPNGTVKFWIPGGDLDFRSSVLEMLVVAGNGARIWGTGTLNGAAARFRITAVDGGSVDAVRIELWAAGGALVYDSQGGAAQDAPVTTRIDGGNIQIHGK